MNFIIQHDIYNVIYWIDEQIFELLVHSHCITITYAPQQKLLFKNLC